MKPLFKIFLLFFLITVYAKAEYKFSSTCKIYISDANGKSDSIFQDIKIPGYFFNYNDMAKVNYVKYKFSFDINDKTFQTKDSLFLVIPSIASADITLINGNKIGQSGLFPPNFKSGYSKERIYYIPKSYLNNINELEIKLYSPDINGGILVSTPTIYTSKELKQTPPTDINQIPLPISNGKSTARFHPEDCYFSHFYQHLYQQFNNELQNKPVLEKLTPVLYKNGVQINLQFSKNSSKLIKGTGIIQIIGEHENTNIKIFAFCPFSENEPLWIFYLLIEGENFKQFIPDFVLKNPNSSLSINKEVFSNSNQKWLRLIIHHKTDNQFSITKYKNLNSNFDLLKKELKWWKNWQKVTKYPIEINKSEQQLYIQSIVLMKMAQVREDFPAKGQIVSSFPPHENRTNLFDQAVIIEGLLRSGHYDEAVQCIQFLLRGKCNKHRNLNFVGNNVGLLNNYALSVNDYYGNNEEKPVNPEDPVISLAGFGLTLSNIRQYLEITDDSQFLEYYWEKIYREIAVVLINLIDNTNLVREDAGLFEKPLPGTHNTSTSAIIYNGLVDAAWMGRMLNQESAIQEFEFYANKIRIAIEHNMWDKENKEVRSALEGRTKDIYIDASITALNNYIYTPQDEIFLSVVTTLKKYLSNTKSPLIYSRVSFEPFQKEISLFYNFRFAENYFRLKNRVEGNAIINYIVEKSKQNNYLLNEKISPIFGYGLGDISIRTHSAFIKAMHERK